MVIRSINALMLAAVAVAQRTSLETFFLLPGTYIPQSIEASVITSYTEAKFGDSVTTLRAACPSAASPENDACRAMSSFPMDIYHTQGSIFGGTMTAPNKERTTTWECALGTGNDGVNSADCSSTVVEETKVISNSSETFHTCQEVNAHVPLVITAGLEKLKAYTYTYEGKAMAPAQLLGYFASSLSSLGCPPRPTLSAGSQATQTTAAAPTTSTSMSSPSSVISTASNVTPAPYLAASVSNAVPTTSSKSSASRIHILGVQTLCFSLSALIGLSFVL